jgi:hypothetical protein
MAPRVPMWGDTGAGATPVRPAVTKWVERRRTGDDSSSDGYAVPPCTEGEVHGGNVRGDGTTRRCSGRPSGSSGVASPALVPTLCHLRYELVSGIEKSAKKPLSAFRRAVFAISRRTRPDR